MYTSFFLRNYLKPQGVQKEKEIIIYVKTHKTLINIIIYMPFIIMNLGNLLSTLSASTLNMVITFIIILYSSNLQIVFAIGYLRYVTQLCYERRSFKHAIIILYNTNMAYQFTLNVNVTTNLNLIF